MVAVEFLEEPALEFRYGQVAVDPRVGLSLFGPFDFDLPSHPASIPYGVVGTARGMSQFQGFTGVLRGPICGDANRRRPWLWVQFPGFGVAYGASLPSEPTVEECVDESALVTSLKIADRNRRAYAVVDLYLAAIARLIGGDRAPALVVCVVPDSVYESCRPQSTISNPQGIQTPPPERLARVRGLKDITRPDESIEPFRLSPDFRRQIKARAMRFEPPIQIIRESTLRIQETRLPGERLLSPLSDRAWNLSTALYYKAGGRPWRLASAREGVCYVGVVFHRLPGGTNERYAACAAQMFLDDGDGVVLRGESGPWYSPSTRQFHLSNRAAHDLLTRVLKEYGEGRGKPLTEVFLHYRAEIELDEFRGYESACPAGVKLVAVKIRTQRRDVRLYRSGTRPVLRGTLLRTDNRRSYVWASGFKPTMGTYDGVETPAPLEVRIQFGDGKAERICADVLGLTKLNYNECKLGDAIPVTIGFSEAVGEILVSNPAVKTARTRFKYYI